MDEDVVDIHSGTDKKPTCLYMKEESSNPSLFKCPPCRLPFTLLLPRMWRRSVGRDGRLSSFLVEMSMVV